MRRIAFIAVLLLSSCAGDDPPSTVADACQMQSEKPHWFKAMSKSEQRWGVPVSVQLATIARESSFESDARPTRRVGSGIFSRHVPISSAYGYSQALEGTWEGYMHHTGRHGADRDDFADSADFIGWYMAQNSRANGVAIDDAYNQYLAYHEGHTGFSRGTYRKKPWLPKVARDVEAWAVIYDRQLRSCPIRR